MQADFLVMLGHLLGAIVILSFGITIPGLAAIRILDPTADRFRQIMLTPAIGLLLLLGLSGWTVLIMGGYSSSILVLLIIAMNGLGISIIERKSHDTNVNMSAWMKLEKAMGIEREDIDDEHDIWSEDTWSEVEEQRAIQRSRPNWWAWPILIVTILCLAPLFLFKFPHGVDWIGFSTLSHSFATKGSFSLPSPSVGNWTYPPAFPAVAALLEQSLNIGPESANFILAQIGLLCLILGIVGVCDRWGGGISTLVAMGLAAGIFAKAHDSGWPTVLSQLGLVLGLLVVIKPAGNRRREHDIAFSIGVLSVSVIHPTGAIYLGTLLFANLIVRQLNDREDETAIRMATISATMLAIAAAITFLVFAPRILEDAVFAEYGWQGGWPMVVYTSPLLPVALYFGWRLRKTVEGSIVMTWLLFQWLLTLIHLFDGISIPVLNLLSLSLYSMGIHGFHIPAAVLLGMAFSREVEWTALNSNINLNTELEDADDFSEHIDLDTKIDYLGWEHKWFITIAVVAGLLVTGAAASLLRLGDHAELFATTNGDREIANILSELPEGTIIYVENSHWGHVFDVPEQIGITAHPSLGIVDIEHSIQSEATKAIRLDDTEKLVELGISHAISSPLGGIGWTLTESPYWRVIYDFSGARLWELSIVPTTENEGWFSAPNQGDCDASNSCQWRKDNWHEQRTWSHEDFTSMRPFLPEGELLWNSSIPPHLPGNSLNLAMLMECSEGVTVTVELRQSDWMWQQNVNCDLGWAYARDDGIEGISLGEIQIMVRVESGGSETWINPLGLSGRGDRIIDESGVKIHWIEFRRSGK